MPQWGDLDDPWCLLRVSGCKGVGESEADGGLLDAVAAREMELGLEDDQGYRGVIREVTVGDLLQLGFKDGPGGVFIGLDEETINLVGFIVDTEFCGM